MMNRVLIGPAADFAAGTLNLVTVEDTQYAVANVDGQLYAYEDRCTHDDSPMGRCYLDGCEVQCPRHGARFNVKTGAAVRLPAVAPLEVFTVTVENGDAYLITEE